MKSIALFIALLSVPMATAGPAKDYSKPVELLRGDVLSGFREAKQWNGVKEAKAVPGEKMLACAGKGKILTNVQGGKARAPYLFTAGEFEDVEVHLEFMVPKGSNSGIYLMGRYEIQILDSFGKENPGHGDLGGLYQRWDSKRGKGKEGYEGVGPKKNAAKAAGEWQTFDITFRAPRFDKAGKKTENARFVKVVVNGVTVHENQEVTGPTRAHPLKGEAAKGPISIQGDHGPIAIRSFKVKAIEAK